VRPALHNVVVRTRLGLAAGVVVVVAVLAVLLRPPITNPALAHELIRMERESLNAQVRFDGPPGQFQLSDLPDALRQRVDDAREINQRNKLRLEEIMDQHGWPRERAVGREGAHAAMRILQRSDGDAAFFSNALSLIEKAGADDTPDFARLVDRIAVSANRPQTYGTMWTCFDGEVVPMTPIKDEANLDARRRSVGLGPYAEEIGGGPKFAVCGFDEPTDGSESTVIEPRPQR
jgi:hypothetical protein